MKTGIIFDLDGTLLNTLGDLTDATNHVLRQFGCPERTEAEVRRFVGSGARWQLTKAFPEGTDIDAVLPVYLPYYAEHSQIRTKPYEGIMSAMAELKKKYPLAIVSNKPDRVVKSLCAECFPGYFALGETAQIPRKPAPEMVYEGMKAIGVERCVYVGDSEVDVQTARNAGMPCLSVLWGFRDRDEIEEAGGKYFCDDPNKMIAALEAIIATEFE